MSFHNFYLNMYFYYIESKLYCIGSLSVSNMVDPFKSTIECNGLRIFIRYRRLSYYSQSSSALELTRQSQSQYFINKYKNMKFLLLILNSVKRCYFEVTRSLLQVKLQY